MPCGRRSRNNCRDNCRCRCVGRCRCDFGRFRDNCSDEYCISYCCSCCGHRGIYYSRCDDGRYCCECCGYRGCARRRRCRRDCNVNVQASLVTGNVELVVGTATPILFPTVTRSEPRSRYTVYDPLTGIFQVPYGYEGNYNVNTQLTVDATSAPDAVLNIAFLVNGVAINSSIQNITGGTTQTFSVNATPYLSNGNNLRVVVTSDVGDVRVVPVSNLSIVRIN